MQVLFLFYLHLFQSISSCTFNHINAQLKMMIVSWNLCGFIVNDFMPMQPCMTEHKISFNVFPFHRFISFYRFPLLLIFTMIIIFSFLYMRSTFVSIFTLISTHTFKKYCSNLDRLIFLFTSFRNCGSNNFERTSMFQVSKFFLERYL